MTVCDSRATYGGDPRYVSGGDGMASEHSHGSPGKPHISKMVICKRGGSELKQTYMKEGQYWTVEADYDYRKNKGATHSNGKQENVMAIGLLYVRKDGTPAAASSSSSWWPF
jgi:hypothetical protein